MLQKEITEAIQKNLSAEVGKMLQSELAELEPLRLRIVDYERTDERTKKELEELRNQKNKAAEIIKREVELASKERHVLNRIAILEVKEEYGAARISDMKEIVTGVFANNRYKYHTMENTNGYNPEGAMSSSVTKEVDKTG